jgi:hypothetical protein
MDEMAGRIRARREWARATDVAREIDSTLPASDPRGPRKFLQLDRWLHINLDRVLALGLHNSSGLTILDIGSGSGLFVFLCSVAGHYAAGTELPDNRLDSPAREIYKLIPEALEVSIGRMSITAFRPLGMKGKVDLLTAFMICFNNHKCEGEWARPEWEFFVHDCMQYLNPSGRLVLGFNSHREKYGELEFFDEETEEYLSSVGRLKNGMIVIRQPPAAISDVS